MNSLIERWIEDLRSPYSQTRLDAVIALGNKRAASAIVPLMEALQDGETRVCFAAVEALEKIGAPALPALIEGLRHHHDSSLRYAAAMILGDIGDSAAIPALMDALHDQSAEVQQSAALALEQIGTGEAAAAALAWRHEHGNP